MPTSRRDVPFRAAAALALSILAAAALALSSLAQAQRPEDAPYRVTVLVSDVGAVADRGDLERRVAEAWAARQRGRGGIFGRTLEIDVRSDGGSVAGAVRGAELAIEFGAHALVCCSTPSATEAVARLAATAGVPLLAPAGVPPLDTAGWAHGLEPDDALALQAVVRDAYARGRLALGLLTLEGPFGDEVRARLDGFLAAPGLAVVGDVRYPPGARVLTPEALQVAVEEPDTVLLWGLRPDVLTALDGLRARGWTGPVYLRPAVLAAEAGGVPGRLPGDVRTPVSPASLPNAAPEEALAWLHEASGLAGGRLESRPLRADGARMHDALTLLAAAFEQVETYGIDAARPDSVHSALRDALIGLSPRTLAAGRYDLSSDDPRAARAEGLVVARWSDGRPTALP